jgi:hypothetical protein
MTTPWDYEQTSTVIENERTLITRYTNLDNIEKENIIIISPSSYDYGLLPTKPTTLINTDASWWREIPEYGQYVSLFPTSFADGYIRHRRVVRPASTYTQERTLTKQNSVRRESFNRNLNKY